MKSIIREHILVCLSSAPSNGNLIRAAAKMAQAFGASLTALHVQTQGFHQLGPEDRRRLQRHIRLAEKLGATVSSVTGEDVAYRIAEYARLNKVTKIVIGRSNASIYRLFGKKPLTERLIELAPYLDIYIIPDTAGENTRRSNPAAPGRVLPSWKQLGIALGILTLSTLVGFAFHALRFTEANTITVYILGVLLTALFTKNHLCSGLSSLASVLLFNFFFTEPRLSFCAYESGYPVTFAIMLIASLITGALAMESQRNAREREAAAILAESQQLRANLLRSISHDLRTPLTSISGNAESLLSQAAPVEEADRNRLLTDIYEDSIWLIQLVENLLSITKLGEGRTQLNLSPQLMDEVITESLRHVRRRDTGHTVSTRFGDGLLMADMDARLMSQVIVNLVDNAMKHTPPGSHIQISARKAEDLIWVCVADNGPGIPDDRKTSVFDMFYTADAAVSDCRRSVGLGLALCKSIVTLHGGEITLEDNSPTGCKFIFSIPASEVNIHV